MNKSRWIVLLAIALAFVSAPVFAQGNSSMSSLTGTVVDKDGGVVPGVTVTVKSDATGVSQTTTTNSSGIYQFPTMDPGTYTVSVSLQGFKKVDITGVRLLAGVPGNTGKTLLEIGALTETVEVKGATDLVRTQSPTVSSTVSSEFISSLPRGDRNALSFLIFLPGVQTSGGAGGSRGSTISGLPQNTINISIDGVTTSNLLQSGDGFFSLVVPRLDAVEEVTLSTAAAGADASGMGASQVKFVTRSGTNQFNVSVYDYFQHMKLNSNTFFNKEVSKLPRPRRTIQNYGGRAGGPIVVPGLFDGHGKAFFFFNLEQTWQPSATSRARTVIRDSALAGNFTYNSVSPQSVNVLTLAQNNGQIFATDPTVMALLGKIKAATQSTGNVQEVAASPNTGTYNYQIAVASVRQSPTARVDLNLTNRHRLSGTYYWQRFKDTPDTLNNADPTFPGFPAQAGQDSYRTTGSSTFRSTFGTNLVNEVLVGWQWSPVNFFMDATPGMFSDPAANQDGYALTLGFGLTNAMPNFLSGSAPGNGPETRNTWNWNVDDNVNWLRGDHSMKFGFSFTRVRNFLEDTILAQNVNLGLSTNSVNDPANIANIFSTVNFPTASTTDLNNARALYGLLTGRVNQLPGTAQLSDDGSTYIFNGASRDAERQDQYGFYAQDSWRWKPNVTVSAGLRYQVQMPMVATLGRLTGSTLTDVCGKSGLGDGVGGRQCNLFKPGTIGNPAFVAATFKPLTPETNGYNIDKNNWAPSVGVNWRPVVENGWGRKLLGDPEQATISGGYARTFVFERVDRFQSVFVGNPGTTTPATRGFTGGTDFELCNPAGATGPCPVLFSQKSRLAIPPFVATPTFPLTALASQSVNAFDPNIRTPYVDSWTVGLQRALTRDMAVEVRYIGNVNKDPWVRENWNGTNFRETGLVGTNQFDNVADQFAKAQANLVANLAAGNGGTFAYTGAPGTSPLPVFLAHFSGTAIAGAGNTAAYTSTQFTNTTWVTALNPFNPNPQSVANNLWTGNNGVWKANAIDSGIYPVNFWVMNPAVNNARVLRNIGSNRYNSMQLDVRRRFSEGLATQVSYTYARGVSFANQDLHLPLFEQRSTAIPHAVKMLWTWDLPVGRGKRFGTNWNAWVDGALGGWTFSGSGRIQVPLFRLSNTVLVGMDQKQAQDLFKQFRIDVSPTGAVTVWNMPKDVVDNTILAYSTSAGQLTPGGQLTYYSGAAPTGRYFAPAARAAGVYAAPYNNACLGLNPGDCAPDLFFYGAWLGEYDFKLVKKFNLPGRAIFEFNIEVFNALKGTNFNPVLNVPDGNNIANTFRVTGQGSAARQAQLVWRVTW